MTTPQNPGDTPDNPEGPQDPQDPQNPYGTPPPPPETAPPPAPAPPYGEPAAPAYGQPAYGQPVQPGYPQYPAPPSNDAPKGMAIAALVISFFGCTCVGAIVSIVLSVIVLRRGKDGRNHGKGLAITALIISFITLLAGIGIAGLIAYASQFESVNDLKAGECITAKGLADEDADAVTEIKTVSCSDKHDGEVLATDKLSADEADNYDTADSSTVCGPAVEAAGKTEVMVIEGITVTALTIGDPAAGDNVACVAYHTDGSSLTGKLGS